MKNLVNDLSSLCKGVIAVVLGILICFVGLTKTLDVYFGIVSIVAGAAILLFALVLLFDKAPVLPSLLVLGGALIALGCGFLVNNKITYEIIIEALIVVAIGGGAALAVHGIYAMFKFNVVYGIGEVAIGAALVTLFSFCLTVPTVRDVLFLIIGLLVIVFGIFVTIYSIIRLIKNRKAA